MQTRWYSEPTNRNSEAKQLHTFLHSINNETQNAKQESNEMVLKIYSIYDSKAEAYLTPFFAPTPGLALRQFETAVNDSSHQFHTYAADFTLFELGDFDQDTGIVNMLNAAHNLGCALIFKKDEANEPVPVTHIA